MPEQLSFFRQNAEDCVGAAAPFAERGKHNGDDMRARVFGDRERKLAYAVRVSVQTAWRLTGGFFVTNGNA